MGSRLEIMYAGINRAPVGAAPPPRINRPDVRPHGRINKDIRIGCNHQHVLHKNLSEEYAHGSYQFRYSRRNAGVCP
jgi:hypothetical protein